MKPKRIILIRHGESEANIYKIVHAKKPDYTMELTTKGLSQADSAGKELKTLLGNESAFFYTLYRNAIKYAYLSKKQVVWNVDAALFAFLLKIKREVKQMHKPTAPLLHILFAPPHN